MTLSTDLADLLARVEAATGPDREIDGLLYCMEDEVIQRCWPHWGREQRENLTPRYTASLDAALALVERVLPGSTVDIGSDDNETGRFYYGVVWPEGRSAGSETNSRHSMALALVASLLRALSTDPIPTPGRTENPPSALAKDDHE